MQRCDRGPICSEIPGCPWMFFVCCGARPALGFGIIATLHHVVPNCAAGYGVCRALANLLHRKTWRQFSHEGCCAHMQHCDTCRLPLGVDGKADDRWEFLLALAGGAFSTIACQGPSRARIKSPIFGESLSSRCKRGRASLFAEMGRTGASIADARPLSINASAMEVAPLPNDRPVSHASMITIGGRAR